MVKLPSHGAVEAGRGDRGGAPPGGGLGRDRGGSAWPRPRCAGRQPCRLRGLSLPASPGDRDRRCSGAIRAGRRRAPDPLRSGAVRTGCGPRYPAHARPSCVVFLLTGSRLTRTVRRQFTTVAVGHARTGSVNPGPAAHANGPRGKGPTRPRAPRVRGSGHRAPERIQRRPSAGSAPASGSTAPGPDTDRRTFALTTVSPRRGGRPRRATEARIR